jgi:hypothetical protein
MSDHDCYEQVMATLRDMEVLAASMELEQLSHQVKSARRTADSEFWRSTTDPSMRMAFSEIASSTAK